MHASCAPIDCTPTEILNTKYPNGRTALHDIISRRMSPSMGHAPPRDINMEMLARTLIRYGADVNIKDNEGFTPLHLAAARGDISSVKMLLDAGADHDAKTDEGDSVVYAAAYWSHPVVIRELLRRGANPLISNRRGKTPILMAIENERSQAVLLALRHKPICSPTWNPWGWFSCCYPITV